jgi:hypothetical protein
MISERREVGQYGDTHSVALDTYISKAKETGRVAGPGPEAPRSPTTTFPFDV